MLLDNHRILFNLYENLVPKGLYVKQKVVQSNEKMLIQLSVSGQFV